MKQTGIIMSGDHPRKCQDGTKTKTRRVIKLKGYHRNVWDYCVPHNGKDAAFLGEPYLKVPYDAITDNAGTRITCPYIDNSVTIQPIPNIANYGAGDDGRIYRTDKPKPVALKPWLGGYKNSYQMVRIHLHNEYVHQLVSQAFYGMPPTELTDTRHLDGNSLNNKPQNLDWGTPQQNALDRYFHGKLSGENHPSTKLNWDIVEEIRLTRKDFTIPELAQKYNVSHGTIEKIIYGQTWKTDVKPDQPNMERYVKPLGQLWVRETHYRYGRWRKNGYTKSGKLAWRFHATTNEVLYSEDTPRRLHANVSREELYLKRWSDWFKRSSIHMPRWASRITLEITKVRVERVQEISEKAAKAEGVCVVDNTPDGIYSPPNYPDIHRDIFMDLWDSLNAKRGYSWESNPWVWVLSFKLIKSN